MTGPAGGVVDLPLRGGGEVVWVAVAGAAAVAGVLLAVVAILPTAPSRHPAGRRPWPSGARQLPSLARRWSRQALAAAAAGLAVVVLTRWLVAGLATAAVVLLWRRLATGAAREHEVVDQLDGLASWVETLRESPATATGLDRAILETAYAAPPAVAAPVRLLADRLGAGEAAPSALGRLAAELGGSSADATVGGLLLATELRGTALRDVLATLAVAVREEGYVWRRASAWRRRSRRGVHGVLLGATALVVGLPVVNRSYVEPYDTLTGQVVLLAVVTLVGAGASWLRRLATRQSPRSLLAATGSPR